MIISRTPFRLSFFGGGTDYVEFFSRYGGAVLSATINKYCYLSVHHLTPFFKHRFRASYSRTESVLTPEEFEHPLIRETLRFLGQRDGVEISHVADLPGQTGLGSSSAFTVGLLHALHAYRGERTTPEELARQAICIERDRVGDFGGWQDQYATAYGGFRRINFSGSKPVQVQTIGIGVGRLLELEERLLLFYLGTESSSQAILQEQKHRSTLNEKALLEILAMVDQAEFLLVGNCSLSEFGNLLHEAWCLKKTLASGISNTVIDQAYATARAAGAEGGKLLGAGGRGFLCLYVEPERQMAVRQALSELNEVSFRFCAEGSRIIFKSDEQTT
jgi:D-glycero-alpha-D-manno-heptose-7-phosphate kinase